MKMNAILVRRFGAPEVLEPTQLERHRPGPKEVAIEVEFAGITFVETQLRAGRPPAAPMAPELPWVPGNGVGGTVAELGNGVEHDLLGARVVAPLGGSGGYAEWATTAAADLVAVPPGLPIDEAVSLLADGRTATMLFRGAGVRPGDRVLVEAAAGGVGSLLVQLAAGAGAIVIGAAGGERKLALAAELGAAETVDYRADGWAEGLDPVDVVFDGVGGEVGEAAFGLLGPGGRYCRFGGASGRFARIGEELAAERGVGTVGLSRPSPQEARELSGSALAAAAEGRLRPWIGQRLPLAEAAAAHRAIEARGTLGKTLLVP